MGKHIFSTLIFLSSFTVFSQQHDLNYFIERAKVNSPLINKNINNNKIIKLDLKQIERILKNPVISLESNILIAPTMSYDAFPTTFDVITNGSSNYTGYDLGVTNGGQYQAYVSVKQPLLGKMNLKPYKQKADISRNQNENSTSLTVHELEQLVGYQYILCLKSKAQIKNGKTILQLIDEQLNIMHKLVDNAVYKQSDLMLLELEKQNKVLENKSLEDDYKANQYDLNLLCGINETAATDILETEFEMKSTPESASQFLTSYKLDSLSIVADQNISELKYKPQLNAFANAGYNATGIPTFDHFGFSLGLNFSWTLYDGNQRKLEREKSYVYLQTQQFEKEHFITQKEINLNKIKAQLKALNERGIILENQLTQYEKLYKVYENELAHGLVSVMDFKNLLKDLTAKRQEYLMQKMEKQLLVNSYNYWNY